MNREGSMKNEEKRVPGTRAKKGARYQKRGGGDWGRQRAGRRNHHGIADTGPIILSLEK
jgi:hypothetical protein